MNLELWTAADAQAATGGVLHHGAGGAAAWTASGVSIDSRTLRPGDLFVAVSGPNFDGHDFAADALVGGAAAALVARRPSGEAGPYLVVDDTLEGLGALARFARHRCGARIAAVTGSVGKTGTKEALRLALGRSGPTHASAASHNNQWGVPLSLARMPASSAYGVFEVGMNRPGEIAALTRMIGPHVAIITTVEPAHLAFFPDTAAIADAKAEIFEGVQPGGFAILNRDNAHFDRLAGAARARGAEVIGFGWDARADARIMDHRLGPEGSAVTADICGRRATYEIGAPGRHWVMNSLAVLAAVHAIGADLDLAAAAMADVEPGPGRGTRLRVAIPGGAINVIDESYNANPASVQAALAVLADWPGARRRIAVLGDMAELGDQAPALHRDLAPAIEAAGVDLVFTVGTAMAALDAVLAPPRRGGHRATAEEAAAAVAASVSAGDVILVKGSNATGMARVVDALGSLGAGGDA